jgi:predicted DNA-binding protein
MKATIIRFDLEFLDRLRAQADRKGVSLAALIRTVMENWLEGKYQTKSTIDSKPDAA